MKDDIEIKDNVDMKKDNIYHPIHYTGGEIECIDGIRASMTKEAFNGFLKGNCIKYLWRYEHKGGREDLLKCRFYLKALIRFTED